MRDRSELEILYGFIANLRQRHLNLHRDRTTAVPHGQSLAYADALLRHQYMRSQLGNLPPQIAVIGPTQAGKSTLINALLGIEAAEASPLAGFTRHAQGFTPVDINGKLMASLQSLLPDWHPLPMEQLNNDNLNSFAVSQLPAAHHFEHDNFLLWDTPDFDSVNSRDYRSTVPVLCATADVIVLIVSKEKYADQSVWDTLELIAPIQRPLLVVVNKTSAENAAALRQAMEKKLDTAGVAYQGIYTLPYQEAGSTQALLSQLQPVTQLRQALIAMLNQAPAQTATKNIKNWLERYWDDWVTPLSAEIAAKNAWHESIDKEQQATLDIYQRDYLQQPHYAETLNKAIVRLLELLEIPMLASGLGTIRQIITWPARKLGHLIKDQTRFGSSAKEIDQETVILQEAGHHFLIALENRIASAQQDTPPVQQWWKSLAIAFTGSKADIERRLEQSIKTHQQGFQPEIEAAANNLYAYLQQHPVTLNGLRTARVGADAAAVLLAIKTGGLSLHDLALAPAFVAVTSFLTEGAVGQHMRGIEAELKDKQLESVRQIIFLQTLTAAMQQLTRQMPEDHLYGISEQALNEAEIGLASLNG